MIVFGKFDFEIKILTKINMIGFLSNKWNKFNLTFKWL